MPTTPNVSFVTRYRPLPLTETRHPTMTPTTKIALATTFATALVLPFAAVQADGHAEVDLGAVPSGDYANDPTHSYVTFSYNHLGLSEPVLAFDEFTIDMTLDNEDVANSSIAVTIDPASVVAGSDIWKEHLTGADFFDVANHPEVTFQSTAVSAGGDGAYKVDGDLTIKGESRPVTLSVTVNAAMNHPMSGDPVVGITGSADVLRSDFGMGKFAPNVSDEVAIAFTAEMVKSK